MSLWTVERTGDLLTLDDSRSVGQHKEALVRAVAGQGPLVATLKAGGMVWHIKGDGFELETMGSVDRAIRVAALSSDWRELAGSAAPTKAP